MRYATCDVRQKQVAHRKSQIANLKQSKYMKTILRRILFPLALFVSISISGKIEYASDYQYKSYDYQSQSHHSETENYYQSSSSENNSWFTPFASGDGMGGFPGDPGSGNGGGMGDFPGDPGNNDWGGMGDLPGDPGKNLPVGDNGMYVLAALGLLYGVVRFRFPKIKNNSQCTADDN